LLLAFMCTLTTNIFIIFLSNSIYHEFIMNDFNQLNLHLFDDTQI